MKKKILFILIALLVISCKKEHKNTILEGTVFGTYYRVTYDSDLNYQKQIDSLFYVINKSMSTYQIYSDISKINRNEEVAVDAHFKKVFETSKQIYKATSAAFDPTIGAVVNAWDFGPEGKIANLDSLKVDSLMQSVGFNKVTLKNNHVLKQKETFIDFNAIAKGYAVDVVSEFLQSQNAKNHLVDIGGELRASGINIEKKSDWKVGVENPNFDGSQSINRAIALKDKAMATSGTYRKFKVDENGNRYAHIIDTKTGYPSKTNLLSISVIADDCMTADAYATAFKAMGIEKVKTFLKSHPELKVFLIFENKEKALETLALNDFPEN
ncbi:FAD:protein FMN transferase [Hwangdonia lutea]|uniref:FAD:protein FMN transferase n=1 Tax=Hwangdonia lutea TaxID=3075823 RepID=A0AA97HNS6_9FLAO|nr:FAD:protein FMN transferase [Hwangdonia sp. SCSIO 19198]WOD42346.1 FAD:protein FMN transferase [Hwangdonia sp. SCSIO 19198]